MKTRQTGPGLALGWSCRCGAEVPVEGDLCGACRRADLNADLAREAVEFALWLELGETAYECMAAEYEPGMAVQAALWTANERHREAWSANYLRAWAGRDSMDKRERTGYWPTWPFVPLTRCVEMWLPDDWIEPPEADPSVALALVEADEHCWVVWYPARAVVDVPVGTHL